jgi:hypothetical protein
MGIPLGQWSGSDATNALREAVEKIARDGKRRDAVMLWMTGLILALTIAIAWMTLVMLLR